MISSIQQQEEMSKKVEGCFYTPPMVPQSQSITPQTLSICHFIQSQIRYEKARSAFYPSLIESKLKELEKQLWENSQNKNNLDKEEELLSKYQNYLSLINMGLCALSMTAASTIGGLPSILLYASGTLGISAELIKPLNDRIHFFSDTVASYAQTAAKVTSSITGIFSFNILRQHGLEWAFWAKEIATGVMNFKNGMNEDKVAQAKSTMLASENKTKEKQQALDEAYDHITMAMRHDKKSIETLSQIIKTQSLTRG